MNQWVILLKTACYEKFELNTSSYRVFYGLLEYHKIITIEPTELKLWRFKGRYVKS